MRNAVAVGVFLFGTTFLWLTPAMSGKAQGELTGGLWTVVQVLAWLAIVAFAASAWAIFRAHDWWVPTVIAAAVVGVLVALTYLVAVRGVEGVANVASNVAIHAGVSLLILAAVIPPPLRETISQRLS